MEPSILADIEDDGVDSSFDTEVKETPPVAPAEEKPVVEEPADKGDNTHPEEDQDYKERTGKRVQQLLKERAEERTRVETLERQVQELSSRGQEPESIPERWSRLFSTGDPDADREAYGLWKTMNQEEKASWKAELLEEMRAEANKTAQEQEAYAEAYEGAMDELEADGKTFDRNELMKFITERPIFRQDGQPDFATALELMEAKKPSPNIQARKALAAIKPQGTISARGYATPDDLRGGFSSI